MLDCQMFGLNPKWHHLTNLLLHIINTLLLFAVLKKMTTAFWPSAFVAALFALHPLHVESVAWISERKDLLSTFFLLCTIAAYLYYLARPAISRYLLILLLFALGLMAKPMLVTLPLVLLLLDYWPLDRFQKTAARHSPFFHLLLEKVPFFALSIALSIVTILAQQDIGALGDLGTLAIKFRLANAALSYLKYIAKMFYPTQLAVFYPHLGSNVSMTQAYLAFLLLLIITALAICFARRYKYLLIGWLLFLITLVPAIGLIQAGSHALADRYTYIPLTGLFIIIAFSLPDLFKKFKYRRITFTVSAIAILLTLSISSRLQIRHWKNSTTLFERALAVNGSHPTIHHNLGTALHLEGKLDEALTHYKKTLELRPNHSRTLYNIGLILKTQGKTDEAVSYFQKTLQVKPDYPQASKDLANLLLHAGKLSQALPYLKKALQAEPDNLTLLNDTAWILATSPNTTTEDAQQAVTLAERAAVLTKNQNPSILDTLAATYAAAGQFDQAVKTAEQAIQLAQSTNQKDLAAQIQNRLNLYLDSKPYIQE
jgi:tetratricopeptide (TPR) repeat protein